MKERPYQKRIEDMLTRFGWSWWHVPSPVRYEAGTRKMVPAREAAGLCDIIATHHDPPRLLFLEVKGDGGKLSDKQQDFLQRVKAVADETKGVSIRATTAPPLQEEWTVKQIIGVHAVWPEDEERVEAMLRSRNVA